MSLGLLLQVVDDDDRVLSLGVSLALVKGWLSLRGWVIQDTLTQACHGSVSQCVQARSERDDGKVLIAQRSGTGLSCDTNM